MLRPDGAPYVSRLSIAPVKGLALQHPDAVQLEAHGAVGDRRFVLVDPGGAIVSITRTGAWVGLVVDHDPLAERLTIRHPDGREWSDQVVLGEPVTIDAHGLRTTSGRLVEGPWSAVLSEMAASDVRLVRYDDPGAGADVEPVTVLSDASVARVAQQAGVDDVDPRRFRMLIGVGGAVAHAEDEWQGLRMLVGDALLEIGGPVPRCAAVTRHPDAGHRDLPLVKAIREYRGVRGTAIGPGVPLGVYARVIQAGRVRVGDPIVPATVTVPT
ncbi:MAG: MOSC domain-containing protein [Solirubrobacteraceae bacterium]